MSLYGAVPLADVVLDLCVRAGLSSGDVDVTALVSAGTMMGGYAIGRETDTRGAMQPLQDYFFIVGIETDFGLRFVFLDGTPVGALSEDDLGARSENVTQDEPKVTETRKQEVDLPQQISIKYVSQASDYQTATQSDKRPAVVTKSLQKLSLDAAISLDDDQARAIAEKALYLAWIGRTQLSLSLPRTAIQYDPGDVVTVVYGDGAISVPMFIESVELGADGIVKIDGHATDAATFTTAGTSSGGSVDPQAVSTPATISLQLLDLPALRARDEGAFGLYFAMASDDFKGGVLYQSLNGGSTYTAVGNATVATTMGLTSSVLAAAAGYDVTHHVDVTVSFGATLAGVTHAEALLGANLCLIGLEVLSFETATLLSPGVYRLTNLNRGLFETELAVEAHFSPEYFVMLSPASTGRFTDIAANLNALLLYKAVAAGQTIEEATAIGFINTGRSDDELTITPVSPNIMRLNWGAFYAPLPPSSQEVGWSIDGGATWTTASISGTVTTYDITPAVPGVNYLARVRATSASTTYVTAYKTASLVNSGGFPAGGGGTAGTRDWILMGSLAGQPSDGQILFEIECLGSEGLPAGLTGSRAKAVEHAPLADATSTLKKNGASIGTMKILAGATNATFTFTGAVTFAAGDIFSMTAPSPQDADLAGLAYTIVGTR